MSAIKEMFIGMTEVESMREYLEDDLEQRDQANLAFHAWAIEQHETQLLKSLNLDKAALPEMRDLFFKMLCDNQGDLLDAYNEERIDTATGLFNYYRQAYKMRVRPLNEVMAGMELTKPSNEHHANCPECNDPAYALVGA